jgi:enamine deaminase RidA (YjgF/YER057c/UK114 family)
MSAEKKLKELGITLPPVSSPVATYVNAVQTGNLLYLSGKGPLSVDGKRPSGKLGREFTIEQGYQHARSTGLDLIAVMKAELGSLDRVRRIVKVLGMVNCVPEFTDPPKVINGASDLFVEVFGDRGRHARSAVGMNSLPMGIPVEIELIVEVEPARERKAAARKPAKVAKAAKSVKKKAAPRKARR